MGSHGGDKPLAHRLEELVVLTVTGLDQPSTAGSCAALHWVGTDMVDLRCIPPGCQNGDQLGSAALDADEGL